MSDRRTAPPATAGSRAAGLDGLRGLAATTVLALHYSLVFVDTSFPAYRSFSEVFHRASRTPLVIFWGGSQAVILFFILSGFVLYRMLAGGALDYPRYVLRRVVRLWIPYAAVITVASAGLYVFGSRDIAGQSAWLNDLLGPHLSAGLLLQHLLMIGTFDTKHIDPVIWSLVLEMRLSLVFPLIYWGLTRLPGSAVLAASVAVAVLGSLAVHHTHAASTSWYSTAVCQLYFVIGAVVAANEAAIVRFYARLPRLVKGVALAVALLLYCGFVTLSATYTTLAGAAWIFIVALCSVHAGQLLRSAPVQWLGRISYSLYLCHCVVLLLAINVLYPTLPFTAIVGLCVPAAFIAASLLCRYIEEPAIRLSRALARKSGAAPLLAPGVR